MRRADSRIFIYCFQQEDITVEPEIQDYSFADAIITAMNMRGYIYIWSFTKEAEAYKNKFEKKGDW